MRILHVMPTVDPAAGGPVEGVRQRGVLLKQQRHEVEVATLDAPGSPWLAQFPLALHALGPGWGKYRYSPRLVPWLREHAAAFDAIVVNGLWQYPGLAVRRALRGMQVPYVVFVHGMLDPWFKRAHPLKHLKKSLYWRLVERRVLADAAAVLFTSEDERVRAGASFAGYRCRERVVAYGTAAPPAEAERQREAFLRVYPMLAGKRILLFLGRVHLKKGVDLLLRAFRAQRATRPELALVVAGPDPDGLAVSGDGVIATGMLSGEIKWGAYRSAEAFVLPSHQENFAIAACEALACGVPVLLSDQVNIWREVAGDGAGLVEPDDAAGVDRLLSRWLGLPAAERAAMRTRAEACFRNRFDVSRSAAALLEVVAEAAAHRREAVPA